MQQIVLDGVKPYDGSYDLDLGQELTTREWGWFKRLAGYLPTNLDDEAWGDPEVALVLAVIAMRRAGAIENADVPRVFEKLADAPFGSTIRIEGEPDVEDAPDPPSSSTSNGATSGAGSTTSSGTSPPAPNPTGIPDWDSSTFAPPTLAS